MGIIIVTFPKLRSGLIKEFIKKKKEEEKEELIQPTSLNIDLIVEEIVN